MAERPILFSGDMVRAILDGRKTMTRRIIKNQPTIDKQTGDWYMKDFNEVVPIEEWIKIIKGKYQIGDTLWVRETFALHPKKEEIIYKADGEVAYTDTGLAYMPKWKPSIFMPRLGSRITLEITDIKVERLHEMSEDDAKKEGVEIYPNFRYRHYLLPASYDCVTAKESFATLWSKINGPESYNSNPFVWAISFKKLPTPLTQ